MTNVGSFSFVVVQLSVIAAMLKPLYINIGAVWLYLSSFKATMTSLRVSEGKMRRFDDKIMCFRPLSCLVSNLNHYSQTQTDPRVFWCY